MLIEPAVREVGILHLGHVHERIMITVHRHVTAAVVRQDTGMQRLMVAMLMLIFFAYMMMVYMFLLFERYLPTSHDIRLRHEFGIEHQIDGERFLQLRAE